MERIVVALFDDVKNAQRAVEELMRKGFNMHDISVVRPDEQSGRRTDLANIGVADTDVSFYAAGIRAGGTLVTVRTSESEYDGAMQVLNGFAPVSSGARLVEPRPEGGFATQGNPDPYTGVYARRFEDLEGDFRQDWGTRYSSGGHGYERYRPAYQYGWQAHNLFWGRDWDAIEPELQADWLHSHPGDDWTEFKDAARTGWERCHGVGDASQAGEQGADGTAEAMSRGFEAYERDCRANWESTYRTTGFGYERYRPAYQYGYALAAGQGYRGRDWHALETDARREWETQHPSEAWADFRDAVRHAWERVRTDLPDSQA